MSDPLTSPLTGKPAPEEMTANLMVGGSVPKPSAPYKCSPVPEELS